MVTSGGVAEWLGRGLQSPVLGFESQRRLECLTDIGRVLAKFVVSTFVS